ncbi:hypothetical protein GQ457_16G016480 [Hibiscus cannabinus]
MSASLGKPEDPRLPEKQHRRDEDPSYVEDLFTINDDDIDLLDKEVHFDELDEIPFIIFSECVQFLTLKSMDLITVVKALDVEWDSKSFITGFLLYRSPHTPLN